MFIIITIIVITIGNIVSSLLPITITNILLSHHILKTTFQIESDLSVTLYINVDMHVSS